MSTPSLLLALPPEVRTEIWRYLLCSYDTVNLDLYFELLPDMANKRSQEFEVNKEKDEDRLDQYAGAIRSEPALPVSILRVNHQLHTECSFFLYRNRLHFHFPPPFIVHFLKLRSTRDRAHIRHLGFGWAAINSIDNDVLTGWQAMHKYIATELRIQTVTAWVPFDPELVHSKWLFRPALEDLLRMLLDGGIESVRLLFASLTFDFETEEITAPVWELIKLPKDTVPDELFAVGGLLCSRIRTKKEDAIRKSRLLLKVEREDGVGGFSRRSESMREDEDRRDVGSMVALTKEG